MNEMNDHSNPATPLIEENLTCNSECGLDLKLGQGCDGHECKYIAKNKCKTCGGSGQVGCHAQSDGDCDWEFCPQKRDDEPNATERHCPRCIELEEGEPLPICPDCNGSGVQTEAQSKSVIKRLVEPKEQTEEDKIREAFETGANEIYCLDKWAWGNYKHQVIEIYLEHYSDGYKSRQQEIEELNKDLSHYWKRIKKAGVRIDDLEYQLSEKDKQIAELKRRGDTDTFK